MSGIEIYLPWLGLAVGVLALLMRERGERAPASYVGLLVPLVCALAAWIGARFVPSGLHTAMNFVVFGALAGAVVQFASMTLRTSAKGALLSAFGLAAFAVGMRFFGGVPDSSARFAGLLVGVASACVPLGAGRRSHPGLESLVALFSLGIVAQMTQFGYRDLVQRSQVWLGLVGIVVFGLFLAVQWATKEKRAWIAPTAAIIGIAALSWGLFSMYLGERRLAIISLVGVAAVIVTAWLVPRGKASAGIWGVAALLWLGLTTYAFSTAYGLGMAAAGFTAVCTVFLLDRRDLLPAVSLLLGLAFYRLFRENNPTVVQAFDIGQHYAMIGFVIGVVTLVGLTDALMVRRNSSETSSGVARALAVLMSLVVIVIASVFFGSKGAIGVIVGLGIAPFLTRLTAKATAWSVVGAIALQGAALAVYGPISDNVTLDRSGKTLILVWSAAVVLALLAGVWLVERRAKNSA